MFYRYLVGGGTGGSGGRKSGADFAAGLEGESSRARPPGRPGGGYGASGRGPYSRGTFGVFQGSRSKTGIEAREKIPPGAGNGGPFGYHRESLQERLFSRETSTRPYRDLLIERESEK